MFLSILRTCNSKRKLNWAWKNSLGFVERRQEVTAFYLMLVKVSGGNSSGLC